MAFDLETFEHNFLDGWLDMLRKYGAKTSRRSLAFWNVEHKDRDGKLLFAEYGAPNMTHDLGEQFLLQVCFDEQASVPASYYIALDNRASLAEADVIATMETDESSGNGYARVAIASDDTDWTVSKPNGDYQALSKTVTFTADGGAIGPELNLSLVTVAAGAGVLISSKALSQSRTLADGESLDASILFKFTEP